MSLLAALTLKVSAILLPALIGALCLRTRSASARHWVLAVGVVPAVAAPALHVLPIPYTDDLPTFLGAPLVLVAVALVACWLPGRRATRVQPMEGKTHECHSKAIADRQSEMGAALLRRRPKGLLPAARQELLDPSKAWWGGRRGRLADWPPYSISVSLGVVPRWYSRVVEVPVRIEVAAGFVAPGASEPPRLQPSWPPGGMDETAVLGSTSVHQ